MKKTIMFFAAMAMLSAVACTKDNGGKDNGGNDNGEGTVPSGDITLITWDEEVLELDYSTPEETFVFEYSSESEADFSLLVGLNDDMSGAQSFADEDNDGKVSLTHKEFDGLLEKLGVGDYKTGKLYWCIEGKSGGSAFSSDVYTMSVTRYLKPFVDPRDNEVYRVMRSVDAITGDYSIWLADNLRADKYSDGTPLTEEDVKFYTTKEGEDESIVDVYGAYYSWTAVMRGDEYAEPDQKVQGICPEGWHVPTEIEWAYLINNTPDNEQPGEALKDSGYWSTNALPNTNELKCNIVGAGYIWQPLSNPNHPVIENGEHTYFWIASAPEDGKVYADKTYNASWNYALTYAFHADEHGATLYPYPKDRGYNLRCVLD